MPMPADHIVKQRKSATESVRAIAWLASQTEYPKFFWSDRDSRVVRAGAGCLDRIQGKSLNDLPEAFRKMRQKLGEGASYFGGVAFNDRCCAEEWQGFGAYDFIFPKKEWDPAFSAETSSISDEHYRMVSAERKPNFEVWEKTLSHVFEDFDRQVYQKIVLSRSVECHMDRPVNPYVILRRLGEQSINSCVFGWIPEPNRAYLGATPERLFKRSGQKIEGEAVAGTKPRGQNAQEDVFMEKELFSSLKNESEHRYVVDYILKAFRQLCREYSYDKTIQLLKLTDNQHLLTKFQGMLKDDVGDADIIRALHPTPAVGGFPRESAVAKILSYEAINRGWFTGLIGSVGLEDTELAVAIRSGLIRDDKVYLYAGAGIVEGSEAQDEWDEIDGKMKGWMKVLQE